MSDIEQALKGLFECHRIVFWYDVKEELQAEFEAVALAGVVKVVIGNNQFGLKYRMMRQEMAQNFLLYHAGPPPALRHWHLNNSACVLALVRLQPRLQRQSPHTWRRPTPL